MICKRMQDDASLVVRILTASEGSIYSQFAGQAGPASMTQRIKNDVKRVCCFELQSHLKAPCCCRIRIQRYIYT